MAITGNSNIPDDTTDYERLSYGFARGAMILKYFHTAALVCCLGPVLLEIKTHRNIN